MGRPYGTELQRLGVALDWASEIDCTVLRDFVRSAESCGLVCVGTGGSLAAAHFSAMLHRYVSRMTAIHATPLEFLSSPDGFAKQAVIVVSASGRNTDVRAVADVAISSEARSLACVTTKEGNPLASRISAYDRGYAFEREIPTGRDGFLATNTLLATMILLARAYGVGIDIDKDLFQESPAYFPDKRDTVLVLHGGWSTPVATDLESRLHESALVNVQISDYRNFGHGRHLWLSRYPQETSLIALVTPETAQLAERTLRYVPPDIPVTRMAVSASGPAATIGLVVRAMHWTGALGRARGVDPGRPVVPEFGRKLYHARPPRARSSVQSPAVSRKLEALGLQYGPAVSCYESALEGFLQAMSSTKFGALALDYDGTLCTSRNRGAGLTSRMAEALHRVLQLGMRIGIATGRGGSAGAALRAALPRESWDQVDIGYYNGAEILPLSREDGPNKARDQEPSIARVEGVIRKDPLLLDLAEYEVRPQQVTLTPRRARETERLWKYIAWLVEYHAIGVRVVTSDHSVDVIAKGVSKTRVVEHLSRTSSSLDVCAIGDCGAWPGNDYEMLAGRYSLSVDRVSPSRGSCWNLAPRGCCGPEAALLYLYSFESSDGFVRFVWQSEGGASR